MKQTHTQTEGCGYRERRAWTSVLVILLSFSLESMHLTSGGAGWLSHRAGELQVLRQEVCRIGATKARRKIKVSLAWHKAGFNNTQHHLPLKQMQTVCLKVTSIPMAVQGLVRSQCSAEEHGAHCSQAAGHNRWGSGSPSRDQFTWLGLALDGSKNELLKP